MADVDWRRYLWLGGKVVLVLGVTGIVGYWLWFVPVPVSRHVVGPREVVAVVMGTGTLEAHVKATISTKIPGRLKVVLVDQGDTVKVGQDLARLDEHDLGHEVEVEVANVAAKSAAVERLQADIAQAKAVLTQASAGEGRMRRLVASNAVSQDELEKAVESLGVAKAGVTRTHGTRRGQETTCSGGENTRVPKSAA